MRMAKRTVRILIKIYMVLLKLIGRARLEEYTALHMSCHTHTAYDLEKPNLVAYRRIIKVADSHKFVSYFDEDILSHGYL